MKPAAWTAALAFAACAGDPSIGGSGTLVDAEANAGADATLAADTPQDHSDGSSCPSHLVSPEGIVIRGCGDARLVFLPAAKVGGVWRGAGRDGACTATADSVTCPAGPGAASALLGTGTLRAHWDGPATVEGLALEGTGQLPGATTWLSNGFQSWSQSGALAIAPPVSQEALRVALDAEGTEENLRKGAELSWWFTWISGGSRPSSRVP